MATTCAARHSTAQCERSMVRGAIRLRAAVIGLPTADLVAGAMSCAVGQFGVRGRAGRMAQEFGDHLDAAASRMRWVRQLAQTTGGGR